MPDKDFKNRGFYDFAVDQAKRARWVCKKMEHEWLQRATFDLEIEPFEARSLTLGATASSGVFVESEMDRLLDELVVSFSDAKGRLARSPFRQLAAAVKHFARGVLDEDQSEQLVKSAVERQGLKPRGRGLFRSKAWYRKAGIQSRET